LVTKICIFGTLYIDGKTREVISLSYFTYLKCMMFESFHILKMTLLWWPISLVKSSL